MITTASLKFRDEMLAHYSVFQTPVLRTATSLPVLGMIFIADIQSSGWNQNFFSGDQHCYIQSTDKFVPMLTVKISVTKSFCSS
jgi:hypothetical protein